MANFVGRKDELNILRSLYTKKSASLVVIRGRRRIGKSRLIEEFGRDENFLTFAGLPPTATTTAQSQREIFAKQLQQKFKVPLKSDDWWDLLWFLAERTQKGRIIIFFDEISWMGDKDPDFLGKLKTIWDSYFKKNPKLILILCSSASFWINKNILSNTGFVGRVNLNLLIKELTLPECNTFWGKSKGIATFEKLKILAVTGGVPRYLEDIRINESAEHNIQRMCFNSSGILFNEFEQIFSDLFDSRSNKYKEIVTFLAEGAADRTAIAKNTDMEIGGILSGYLENLQQAGFITRDFSWNLKDGKISKLSRYRLSDNYLRFYLKYIFPNKNKITTSGYTGLSLSSLPAWNSIMGLQFENLVLNNRNAIKKILQIPPVDIIADGPYFQSQTTKTLGCQIDYLIQTKFNNLYVCEIKFSKKEISNEIVEELTQKINRLKLPRGFSYRPVLLHVNGVKEEVIDSDFFAKIIDCGELLYQSP